GGVIFTGIMAFCTILFIFAADTLIQAFTPLAIMLAICGSATLILYFWDKYELRFYKRNRNWTNDLSF
ncbi:hypothetical protein, partial [Vreelandella aquamarina]|uniref:hypothetical protein n=1 Tax=Vreelandella aquamarina TaxID=77097 RepID=UPI001CC418A1